MIKFLMKNIDCIDDQNIWANKQKNKVLIVKTYIFFDIQF